MLFTFPSRYWFAIGLSGVFSLIRIPLSLISLRLRDCHPLWSNFPDTFSSRSEYYGVVLLPLMCIATHQVWALPRSLATTGGIISLFSLPGGTKMFQFPPFASSDNRPSACWVVPFGNPRIKGYLLLPAAYRSLSRPSSPPRAKASTRRPNFLSPFTLHLLLM